MDIQLSRVLLFTPILLAISLALYFSAVLAAIEGINFKNLVSSLILINFLVKLLMLLIDLVIIFLSFFKH